MHIRPTEVTADLYQLMPVIDDSPPADNSYRDTADTSAVYIIAWN